MIVFLWRQGCARRGHCCCHLKIFVSCVLNHAVTVFPPVSSDGGTESSALVDDNGSEEDYSYEDLCQGNPRYLQPGGEQLAINEVQGPTHRHARRTPISAARIPSDVAL